MTIKTLGLWVLLLGACRTPPLSDDFGAAAVDMAQATLDLAGLTCAELSARVDQLPQSCTRNSDCAWLPADAALCNCVVVNQGALAAFAGDAALAAALHCPAARCVCDRSPIPVCQNNVCVSGPPAGFGSRCDLDSQCPSAGQSAGVCDDHTGGLCVVRCAAGFTCPTAGMSCIGSFCYPSCAVPSDCVYGTCCPSAGAQICDWNPAC